jgi:hypothetical protein
MERREVWPGIAEQLSNQIRLKTFTELIGDGHGRTLLDLGAGPCLFAKRAAQREWTVTAVDGRTDRLPDDLFPVRFVKSDVRDFDVDGFDTIAILGLLYHLPVEDQVSLLTRCSYTRIILETQVHTPGFNPPNAAAALNPELVVQDGYEGVVYTENDNPMASIGNTESLWMTEQSLLRLFENTGQRSVIVVEPAHYSKYGTRKFYVLNEGEARLRRRPGLRRFWARRRQSSP